VTCGLAGGLGSSACDDVPGPSGSCGDGPEPGSCENGCPDSWVCGGVVAV